MTASAASERFVESVGPIVVKEVRQGLRARVFAVFFGLLLVVCLAVALVAFARGSGGTHGREFFASYLTALGAICFFGIPFIAFRSMIREVEDETWVLLTLTGLGARAIARGKWVSAMSQALLFGSACAPFVVFSYFLNGIDLVQIVTALALAATWTSLLTALGIAIATQAHGKLARTIAHFVVLGVLGLLTVAGIAFGWGLAESGQRLVTNSGFRNFSVGLCVFSVALTWLVLESAAAGLALPSEAASKGPRIALFFVALLVFAFGASIFVLERGRQMDAAGGQVITSFFLTFCGVFCISERDGWPAQVTSGGWLKPGAVRSWWLIVCLLVGSLALWLTLMNFFGAPPDYSGVDRHLRGMIGALVYPVLYLSLAVLIARLTPLRQFGEATATRVAFLISLVFGVAGSMAASVAIEGRANDRFLNTFNPLMGMANFIDRSSSELDAVLVVVGSTALVMAFCASVVLHSRDGVRA